MMKKKTEHKGGRPPKFKADFCRQARFLCELGAIDDQLADFFNVTRVTIGRWKKSHPEFCCALKEGKSVADQSVEKALYQKATGYRISSTKSTTRDGKIIDSTECERELPPDTTACIFWLKNRRPDRWRDKIDHDLSFQGDIEVTLGGNAEE